MSTEKMVLISSTTSTNEWPQNDSQGLNMASTVTRAMEKPTQQQIPQESLKCPRCDSSNTKFCYYNNYSLSQPRHFCKACKRYWTRGGTLRNVPIGGGCRKNKKIKRSISAVDQPITPSSASPTATSSNPNTTSAPINPVFFGVPTNPNPNSEMGTLPYPSFNPRVSSVDAVLGFDHQAQMSGFGLGFSNHEGNYQNGSTNPLHSSYALFGSSNNSPPIACLLGSSLNQQKFINNINNNGGFQGLGSFQEIQSYMKVKREEAENCQNTNFQNHLELINPSDPSLYWNATNVGAWLDPTNIGSSVPSLI